MRYKMDMVLNRGYINFNHFNHNSSKINYVLDLFLITREKIEIFQVKFDKMEIVKLILYFNYFS